MPKGKTRGTSVRIDWTESTILRLRTLWKEGHSTEEIGRRLEVSKNAIVGKAHRLNLPPRPTPIHTAKKEPALPKEEKKRPTIPPLMSLAAPVAKLPAKTEAVAQPLQPKEVVPSPPPKPVHRAPTRKAENRLNLRTATCCWPIGEPGNRNFKFCGDPAEFGKPYCTDHANTAYVKRRKDGDD